MPLYHALVPTRYSSPLIRWLAASDPDLPAALAAVTGLCPDQLQASDGALTIEEFDRLMQALQALTGRSDLGFELGLRITPDSHGQLGKAMLTCQTVGEVLALGARFTRLMSPCIALRYLRTDAGYEMRCQPAAGMSTTTLHAFFEIHVVSLHRLLEDLLGKRLLPLETWMPMPRPAHAVRYASLPRLMAHFGSGDLPEVRTRISAELAALPLAPPGEVPGAAISELQRLQTTVQPARQWRSWVALMLRECEHCQPTQAELAAMLNVSAHTLARHLREEGCSFRTLASQIRHQRAVQMLSQGSYPIEVIAARLGYEHVSNFSHAFRRLAGVPPSQLGRDSRQSSAVVASTSA